MFRFSIITVVFNGEQVIQKTIESVINQTYPNFEYIIIDGSSTDKTMDIVRTYSSRISTVASEPDQGIYDAMNKGLRLCSGDYVIFMNAGDTFVNKNTLSEVIKESEGDKNDFLYADSYEYDPVHHTNFFKRSRPSSTLWYGMFAHHQSMIYSLHIIQAHSLAYDLRYKLAADWDFTARFLEKSTKLLKLKTPVAVFEQGGASSTYLIGLKEQFKIRHQTLNFSLLKCYLLFLIQLAANIIRKYIPSIYNVTRLKSTY